MNVKQSIASKILSRCILIHTFKTNKYVYPCN